MTHDARPLTCADFEALLPDLLDAPAGALTATDRERMAAHRRSCQACDSLATDLAAIKRDAAHLPALSPTRDLWHGAGGIASRIEAEVVEFPVTPVPGQVAAVAPTQAPGASPPAARIGDRQQGRAASAWRLAAAASILVAATAGITWVAATRTGAAGRTGPGAAADSGFAAAMEATRNVRVASRPAMDEAYDREIAELRRIVDTRRAELDSTTVAILERNLRVIDQAIAESKAALAASPQSAFLLGRLADAYNTKLRTLRAVATMPTRG